jgi:hypothetical protein
MIIPETIPCPRCPVVLTVNEEDPDATLADLWSHLGRHSTGPEDHRQLFIQAQEAASP